MSKQSRPEVSRPGTNKKKVESNKSKNKKNQQREILGEKAFEIENEKQEEKAKLKSIVKKDFKHRTPVLEVPSAVDPSCRCIDCGCALNSRVYQNNFDKIIDRALRSGVVGIISFATSETIAENLQICVDESKVRVFCSLYVHPQQKIRSIQETAQFLASNICKPEVIAIGPVAYDNDEKKISKTVQLERFDLQCKTAIEHNVPIIFKIPNTKFLFRTWEKLLSIMKDEMDQKIASLSPEFNPFSAAFSGDLALLKCFYQLQLSLPEEERKDLLTLRDKDHNYAPLIYTATCKGHLDVLAWLLDLGCDANITNGNGDTPLHCAATFNQLDCCIMLLESGAVATVQNKFEETALDVAKKKKFAKIVSALSSTTPPVLRLKKSLDFVPLVFLVVAALTVDDVKALNEKNFHFGFSGIMTEESVLASLREISVKDCISVNKLIVFSNGPYNTPQNIQDEVIRNTHNEPSNLEFIFEALAILYEMEVCQLRQIIFENTTALFSLRTEIKISDSM